VLAFGSNSVNINGSYTFNTGSHGFVQIGKVNRNVDGTVNMSGSVNVGPNVTIKEIGGSSLGQQFYGGINISAPTIKFLGDASIFSTNGAITDIKMSSNHFDLTPVPLTIILPDSAAVSLSITEGPTFQGGTTFGAFGGPTVSNPREGNNSTPNGSTTFLKSAGTGTTSLTVDGGNLFTFGVTTTIGAGVPLAENKSILRRSDNGIIINNGAVNYTGVNATPTVATITLEAPTGNLTLGGTGTFSNNTTSTTLFRTMTANKSVTIADGTALS